MQDCVLCGGWYKQNKKCDVLYLWAGVQPISWYGGSYCTTLGSPAGLGFRSTSPGVTGLQLMLVRWL